MSLLFKSLVATLVFCSTSLLKAQDIYQAGVNKSSVLFEAVGKPSLIKIKGEGQKISGEIKSALDSSTPGNSILNGQVVVELSDLDTGVSLRNEHMKDKYLQIKKYPQAKVNIKDLKVKTEDLKKLKISKNTVQVEIEIHGERKNVDVEYSVDNGDLQTNFELKISDFKIEIPSYMGITVADKVKVSLKTSLSKKSAEIK